MKSNEVTECFPTRCLQIANISDILFTKQVRLRGFEIDKVLLELERSKLEIHHFNGGSSFEIEVPKKNRAAHDVLTLKIAESEKGLKEAERAVRCVKGEMWKTDR